jgi:hypothetical protein
LANWMNRKFQTRRQNECSCTKSMRGEKRVSGWSNLLASSKKRLLTLKVRVTKFILWTT